MRISLVGPSLFLLGILLSSGIAFAQGQHQDFRLVIDGQTGHAGVVQIDGRPYVDLEALARLTNGSLTLKASRYVLTLPVSAANAPSTVSPPSQQVDSGLSRDLMKAGIEEIAVMREWASTLAYAIQNGSPVTQSWIASHRANAVQGLRLASVAATSEADRSAHELLTNEFAAVDEWSTRLLEARKSMSAANYALSGGALQDDPLSQKIVSCGRFLASMLASGSFQDDPSCH